MSNAGLNPQIDNEKSRITIVCAMIQEVAKRLEKGQKAGDATRTTEKGEKEEIKAGEPIIDTTAPNYMMGIDDVKKEAYRTVVVNGKQVQQKLENYKEIKMKHDEWKKREGIEDKNKDHDAR